MKNILNYSIILGVIIISFIMLKRNDSNDTILPKYNYIIEHYSASETDSLKLKATTFLLANMKEFVSSKTNNSKFYNDFALKVGVLSDSIASLEATNKTYNLKNSHYDKIKSIWESLEKTQGDSKSRVDKQLDIESVSSEMLIKNIDLAFEVWKEPWAKGLSFENFCEYILPYRGFGEPVDEWRKQYYEKNIWIKDSMKGSKDRIKACNLINDELKSWFIGNRFFMHNYPGGQGAKTLLESKVGKCVDQVNLSIYSMRSIGLPVTMDYTPLYGNFKTGHTWNTLLLENGTNINFQGATKASFGAQQFFPYKLSKVYRKTFAENKENLVEKIKNYKDIPPVLRSKHFIDVSDEYAHIFTSKDIGISINTVNNKNEKYAYLCTFNNSTWEAIDWSEIKKGRVNFKNMGVGIVYLLAYYNNEKYIPTNNPFILKENGQIQYLIPDDDDTEDIILKRKFPLSKRMKNMLRRLKKGRFQGANKSDFTDAEDLYRIKYDEEIKTHYVVKVIENKKSTDMFGMCLIDLPKLLNYHFILKIKMKNM